MSRQKRFWISLALINLSLVAFLGFCLRSKILFSVPLVNYRYFLSAHSHLAFAGWAGLSLMTLLIFELLPRHLAEKRIYWWVLAGIEISSLGMAFTFPFFGYNAISITFSTLYIVAVMVFAPVFIKDVLKAQRNHTIQAVSVSATASIILSFLGALGLVYILISQSGNSFLYRDSIYTFLHFQYNGFFTLSIVALFLNRAEKKNFVIDKEAKRFSLFLCLSVIPALFLSLLWHNKTVFYVLASLGCVCIILALIYFFRIYPRLQKHSFFSSPLAKTFWIFSALSFGLKLLLNIGTIIPSLGDAVYGARPIIVGFLHLVFLGFLSFYLLASLVEENYFTKDNKIVMIPLVIFSIGIFANEIFLMVQGISILFQTNNELFKWLLWGASILLFIGAVWTTLLRLTIVKRKMP